MYKLLQDKSIHSFANTFTNLAVNLYTSMEPQPPTTTTSRVKGQEYKFTQVITLLPHQNDKNNDNIINFLPIIRTYIHTCTDNIHTTYTLCSLCSLSLSHMLYTYYTYTYTVGSYRHT